MIHYVPCAGHSLNVVGVNSIDNSCKEVSDFFDLLKLLYAFCARCFADESMENDKILNERPQFKVETYNV